MLNYLKHLIFSKQSIFLLKTTFFSDKKAVMLTAVTLYIKKKSTKKKIKTVIPLPKENHLYHLDV